MQGSLDVGAILADRFVLVAAVAAGSQGEVFRAEDRHVRGRVVAVKVMRHPARSQVARELALRELELLAAVRHPSVLQFLDYGWAEDRLWYAMPWLVGETLEGKKLSRAAAQPVFEKLAAGLHALHSAGIRHQDIKPENIFLAKIDGYDEPMPTLLDLGVAVRAGETMAAGSLAYFAPEVASSWPRPNLELDERADVFALALTLREVLEPETMPELPEDEAGVPAFLVRRASEPVAPPSRFELRYLRRAFGDWLSLDPSRRPDADGFRKALAILTEPERRRVVWARRGAITVLVALLVGFGAHQTLRARDFRDQSRVQADIAAERAGEASDAKEDARRAIIEAKEADALAAEAEKSANVSAEAAAHAEALKRAAEVAADRAMSAQERSDRLASAAERARSASELARRAAEERFASVDSERARIAAALATAEGTVTRLTSELSAEQEARRASRARVAELERALDEAQTQRAAAEASLAEARTRTQTAEAALAASESARAALDAEIRTLRARIVELERALAEGSSAPPATEPTAPAPLRRRPARGSL